MEKKADIYSKLKILADSAKFDVSCSTSGTARKNNGTIGNAFNAGICHSWAADGRCISLLKVLFTNDCAYNCEYCVNRRSADAERATFEPDELARLVIEFYRRNYIEGLFLSSAVQISPDHTGERMLECFKLLRYKYGFAGYIHAKIIPGTSPELVHRIGLEADRLSVNAELPSRDSLQKLAPQKTVEGIFTPMKQITNTLIETRSLRGPGTMFRGQDLNADANLLRAMGDDSLPAVRRDRKKSFAPAGQTTQMIIGASAETDLQIIKTTENIYRTFKMKRVYYSAYVPVVDSPLLPGAFTAPPLVREHRLYQADWLLRFYGFTADEIVDEQHPDLEEEVDPKVTWALRHLDMFPMEVNKASLEELLRIPGVGTVSALRITRQRRVRAVRYEDLKKMGVVLKRARHFLTCSGRYYGSRAYEPEKIRGELLDLQDGRQLSMFDSGGKAPGLAQSAAIESRPGIGTDKNPAAGREGNSKTGGREKLESGAGKKPKINTDENPAAGTSGNPDTGRKEKSNFERKASNDRLSL